MPDLSPEHRAVRETYDGRLEVSDTYPDQETARRVLVNMVGTGGLVRGWVECRKVGPWERVTDA